MTIEKFIEKAVSQEYRNFPKETKVEVTQGLVYFFLNGRDVAVSLHEILLDPLAWKAVGKVEVWDGRDELNQQMYQKSGGGGEMPKGLYGWNKKMHRMIDALAEGKTIEQYLETL